MVSLGLSVPAKPLVGAVSGCLGEAATSPRETSPRPACPTTPALLPSSSTAASSQLCISEPVFGAADDGLQKGPEYRRPGAHLLTKKPRDLAKYRNFSLTHGSQTCLLFALNPDIFGNVQNTPWALAGPVDKLREKETGSAGRAAGDTGTAPCARARSPATIPTAGDRVLATQRNDLGAGGGTGKAWRGRGADALAGMELRAEPRAPLARLQNMPFIQVADTAVCQAKIFIIQLRWIQWKEARGFLAQWMRITSLYNIWGECGLDNAFYACWQQIFLIGSVPGVPVMIYHIVWRYHLLELSHLWENQ